MIMLLSCDYFSSTSGSCTVLIASPEKRVDIVSDKLSELGSTGMSSHSATFPMSATFSLQTFTSGETYESTEWSFHLLSFSTKWMLHDTIMYFIIFLLLACMRNVYERTFTVRFAWESRDFETFTDPVIRKFVKVLVPSRFFLGGQRFSYLVTLWVACSPDFLLKWFPFWEARWRRQNFPSELTKRPFGINYLVFVEEDIVNVNL